MAAVVAGRFLYKLGVVTASRWHAPYLNKGLKTRALLGFFAVLALKTTNTAEINQIKTMLFDRIDTLGTYIA